MMNGYPSFSQAMQQSGPRAGQCRCQQRCVCRAGQPCRCGGSCTCNQASYASSASYAQGVARSRNWIESGEQEMRRQPARRTWLRTRARNLLQQRVTRQRDWQRRTRLNGMFARRFNWSPYFSRLGRTMGSTGGGFPSPNSQRFMFALARWQRRQGLPVTGILTPSVWRRLMAFLEGEPGAGGPPMPSMPPAGEPMAAAPVPEPAPDDAAMPLPGDAGEPAAAPGAPDGNEFLPPVGFRARRVYAGQV